jgi:hypothetical protein
MSITILIILCIFLALILWIILYTPTLEGLKSKKKPQPKVINKPQSQPQPKPKPKKKFNLINAIKGKIKRIKDTKGGVLLKLLPKSLQKKIASVSAAAKRELKKEEERKRKEKERKQRLQLEKEARERKERAYKTIDKLFQLAAKYPDSKYEIQQIMETQLNDFVYGNNIVNSIKRFVEKSMPDKSQLEMYIKMLRESMSFSPTYQMAELRA